MAKKKKDKKRKKQKIRIFFRDGRKDIIPQRLWDDYDFIAKDSGCYFVVIRKEQWIAAYNMKDITVWTVV